MAGTKMRFQWFRYGSQRGLAVLAIHEMPVEPFTRRVHVNYVSIFNDFTIESVDDLHSEVERTKLVAAIRKFAMDNDAVIDKHVRL